MQKITKENLSVVRFGDGEISLIGGMDLPFQKRSPELVKELEEIIKADHEKLLVCIPGMWKDLKIFEPYAEKFIEHHMYREKHTWGFLLRKNYTYGDTNITRHYLAYKNKQRSRYIFNLIFSLWEERDVLLIEGSKSRIGVGNDLFQKVSKLERVLCPQENAYEKVEEILSFVKRQPKTKLILVSLGPAAKVITYRLFLLGYRVLDIGHIDMEYEMFIRKEIKQTKVDHKYFNEINERSPIDCNDPTYLSQILITIP